MSSFKNVLIVLGCAPKPDGRPSECMISRVRKAIQLYRKENYSKVIISGGPSRGVPESEIMRVMMLHFIPDSKMITERHSRDTVQNAVFCWNILKNKSPKHITVVSSAFHMRRARYIFKKLYAHMGVSLKFESAVDTFDPIEAVFYHTKELLSLAKLMILGFR